MTCFVCFVKPGEPTDVQEADSLKNKTVEEIWRHFKLIDKILFIRTPMYAERLEVSCEPFKKFPQLLLNKRPTIFERPDYYFEIRPLEEQNCVFIRLHTRNQSAHIVPNYYVKLNVLEIQNQTAIQLLDIIEASLELGVQQGCLMFGKDKVNNTENAVDIVDKSKIIPLIFDFALNDQAIGKIKRRINIISEIVSTEETYIKDLTTILNHWEKGMRTIKDFDSEDLRVLFNDIPSIQMAQITFLNDLKERGTTYDAEFAIPFIEFAQFFKISQHYIANYPSIVEIINVAEKHKKVRTKLQNLAAAVDGRDLHSYLITPVQRMPRYILFLRDLLKYTPSSHPDSELLGYAFTAIEDVTKQIDDTTKRAKKQATLMHLQQHISNGYVFLDKQRELICQTAITTKAKQNGKGVIYLFNDLIMIVKNSKKATIVIFDSAIPNFNYKYQWPGINSLTLDISDKQYMKTKFKRRNEYVINFENIKDRTDWFDQLRKIRHRYRIQSQERYIFDWDNYEMNQPLQPLVKPVAAAIDDTIYVFSGGTIPNVIYTISKQIMTQSSMKLPPTIKSPVVTSSNDGIYVFSGDSLYFIDHNGKSINKIELSGAQPRPRRGHCMIYYHNLIVIFGGKSMTGKEYYNEIILIDISAKEIEIFGDKDNSPSPRWHSSAIEYRNKMIIFGGGTNKKSYNDLYEFDLEYYTWTKINAEKLLPRKNHQVCIFNEKIMGLFGGNTTAKCTQLIDLESKEVNNVDDFGNFVSNCPYTSIVKIGDSLISISGGYDKTKGYTNIKKIILPPVLDNLRPSKTDPQFIFHKNQNRNSVSILRPASPNFQFDPVNNSESDLNLDFDSLVSSVPEMKSMHLRMPLPTPSLRRISYMDFDDSSNEIFQIDEPSALEPNKRNINDISHVGTEVIESGDEEEEEFSFQSPLIKPSALPLRFETTRTRPSTFSPEEVLEKPVCEAVELELSAFNDDPDQNIEINNGTSFNENSDLVPVKKIKSRSKSTRSRHQSKSGRPPLPDDSKNSSKTRRHSRESKSSKKRAHSLKSEVKEKLIEPENQEASPIQSDNQDLIVENQGISTKKVLLISTSAILTTAAIAGLAFLIIKKRR